MRDFVDEEDYPPSQEYFLYADSQVDFRKLKIKNKYCFFAHYRISGLLLLFFELSEFVISV
jgi:hypothetical protein